MEVPSVPRSSTNHMIEEILQFYIDHHPDWVEKCKPFLDDLQAMIIDQQELTNMFYERNKQLNRTILSMGG